MSRTNVDELFLHIALQLSKSSPLSSDAFPCWKTHLFLWIVDLLTSVIDFNPLNME